MYNKLLEKMHHALRNHETAVEWDLNTSYETNTKVNFTI